MQRHKIRVRIFAPKADHDGKANSKREHRHQRKAHRRFVDQNLSSANDQNKPGVSRMQVMDPLGIKIHEVKVAPNRSAGNPGEQEAGCPKPEAGTPPLCYHRWRRFHAV